LAALSPGPENRNLAAAPDGSPVEKTPAIRGAPRQDKTPRPRVCVVVLGPGRSGTSVTARILNELGVRLNYNPTQMSDQNPDGAFEDEFIYKAHSEFFDASLVRRNLLPVGWMASEPAKATGAKLEAYVRQEFGSDFLWGFKDPRTSVLLPLWKRIFNRARVVPRYVVCVRHPAAFVQSMANNYGTGQNDAELVWLTRTVSALRDTGLDCFILHYERLLADPLRTIRMLAKYALGTMPDPARLKAIATNSINPNLDRAKINNIVLTNPIIPALASALDKCEGSDFKRSELIETLQNCDRILTAFSPLIGNQQQETPARGPRGPSAVSELETTTTERNGGAADPRESGGLSDAPGTEITRLRDLLAQSKAQAETQAKRIAQLGDELTQSKTQATTLAEEHSKETTRLRESRTRAEARAEEIARHVDELTQQRARWRQQTGESIKRHMQRTELMREQLAEQRAQWQQQAEAFTTAHAEETARLNDQIGELEALSAARAEEAARLSTDLGQAVALAAEHAEETARLNDQIEEMEALSAARAEEAARLSTDLGQAVALAAEHAEEIARLGNRLTQQQAHLADSAATHAAETARLSEQIAQREAQLAEMTRQLEQLVEQHRLQTIELKWAATDRENLNIKLASLVALQAANRRAPSPAARPIAAQPIAAQPIAAQRADIDSAVRPATPNGGAVPAQQRDADGSGAKKAEPQQNGASAKWTVRALLRAPRSYLQSWLPTK
jgi:hypothetical protein